MNSSVVEMKSLEANSPRELKLHLFDFRDVSRPAVRLMVKNTTLFVGHHLIEPQFDWSQVTPQISGEFSAA